METKHTPGPWKVKDVPGNDKRNFRYGIVLEITPAMVDVSEICNMPGWDDEFADEEMANAHLIAAAPDMEYALLQIRAIVEYVGDGRGGTFDRISEIATYALKKAKGEK